MDSTNTGFATRTGAGANAADGACLVGGVAGRMELAFEVADRSKRMVGVPLTMATVCNGLTANGSTDTGFGANFLWRLPVWA